MFSLPTILATLPSALALMRTSSFSSTSASFFFSQISFKYFFNWKFISHFQYTCLTIMCRSIVAEIRCSYMKAILRQDAEWLDRNYAGTLAVSSKRVKCVRNCKLCQFFSNIERIREGLGDKLGLLIRGLAMSAASIIIGLIYEWRITLAMLAAIPCCYVCMLIMVRVSERSITLEFRLRDRQQFRNLSVLARREP